MGRGVMRRLVLTALVCLSACQSYDNGMQLICDAPKHCKECEGKQGEDKLRALDGYIEQHLRNEDAKQALLSLKDAPHHEQGKQLRRMATEAGLSSCPMADVMDEVAPSTPAPPRPH